jgi:hypothetical protein
VKEEPEKCEAVKMERKPKKATGKDILSDKNMQTKGKTGQSG